MTKMVRAVVSLTGAGLVADAAMSVAGIGSLLEGTSPTAYGWVTAANFTSALVAVLVGVGSVLIAPEGRREEPGLVAAAGATLVTVSGVRIVGLALVLANITPAQQLESPSEILLSIIGTGTALILLPALFAGASVITTRISRGHADRTAMAPPRRRWSPASAQAPLRLR